MHTNLGLHGTVTVSSPRAIEGGRLYCFSVTSRALVLGEVSLSQIVNERRKEEPEPIGFLTCGVRLRKSWGAGEE